MSLTSNIERIEKERALYNRVTLREARVKAGLPISDRGRRTLTDVSSGVSSLPAVTHDLPRTDIDVCRPSCLLTITDALPPRERRYEAMLYNPTTRDSIRTVLYATDPAALAVKVGRLFGPTVELAGWHPAVTGGETSPGFIACDLLLIAGGAIALLLLVATIYFYPA